MVEWLSLSLTALFTQVSSRTIFQLESPWTYLMKTYRNLEHSMQCHACGCFRIWTKYRKEDTTKVILWSALNNIFDLLRHSTWIQIFICLLFLPFLIKQGNIFPIFVLLYSLFSSRVFHDLEYKCIVKIVYTTLSVRMNILFSWSTYSSVLENRSSDMWYN